MNSYLQARAAAGRVLKLYRQPMTDFQASFLITGCLFLVISLVLPAHAQFTTVSATVHDPSGLPYANGTVVFTLVISGTPIFGPPLNFPYSPPTQAIGMDARGTWVQNLANNTLLTPAGSTWSFHVCSANPPPPIGTGPVCFDVTGIVISGISQDISAQLNAAAPPLTQLPPPGGTVTPPLIFPANSDCTNPSLQVATSSPPPPGITFPVGQLTTAFCNLGAETLRVNASGINLGPNRVQFGASTTNPNLSIGNFSSGGAGWLTINNTASSGTNGGIVAGLNTPCNLAANTAIGTSFCSFSPAVLQARNWSFDCYVPYSITTAGSADSTLTVDITRTLNLGIARVSFRNNNADTQATNSAMNTLTGSGTTSTNILSIGTNTTSNSWVDIRGSINATPPSAQAVTFTLNATGTTPPVGNVLTGAWCRFF